MRPIASLAPALAFVLAAPLAAHAADYHVSPGGDDEAAGTAAAPWRSIGRVNRQAIRPGDRILFEGGAEFAGNLALAPPRAESEPDSPITVGSYGRGRAAIRAGRGTGVRVEDLGGVAIRDLIVVGDGPGASEGFGVLVVHRRGDPEPLRGVRIANVEARGFRWAGICVGGAPDALPGAAAGEGGGRRGFRDVQVRGCVARDNVYHGILVDGTGKGPRAGYANRGVVIADCVAADNPGDPDYAENHSGNGILVGDTDGARIEGCVARNNGAANGGRTGGPVGIWAYSSNDVTIQSCESYDNRTGGAADGGGFDLDGGVTNSVIQYCYSHGNDGPGYLVWNYAGAELPLAGNVIRYNISAGDSRRHRYGALSVGTSEAPIRGLLVHNNTIYATPSAAGEPSCVRVWEGAGEGLRFVNNLFIASGGVPAVDCEAREGVRFEGNAYWAAGGPLLIRHGGRFADLAAWRTAAGQERRGGEDLGFFGDPRLSGLSNEETIGEGGRLAGLRAFRPGAGSPLIDAGVDLDAPPGQGPGGRDFWGTPVPRGQRLDVGAGEYDPPAP